MGQQTHPSSPAALSPLAAGVLPLFLPLMPSTSMQGRRKHTAEGVERAERGAQVLLGLLLRLPWMGAV